jgi:hypothetical protein
MALTLPDVVPAQYSGTARDFLQGPGTRDGIARLVTGTVSVPSGTADTDIVGLIPVNKGARFKLDDKSVYCGNFGGGSTTVSLGFVYYDSDEGTSDPDAFASASAAPQSGGFVTVDENEGLTFEAAGDGWLALTVNTAAADATADVEYSVLVAYA